MKNYFITIEGIEGAGKSTVIQWISKLLATANMPHILTREPGGTAIAEEIRRVLLNHHQEKMCPDTELLLMFAGRAQHLAAIIKPALTAGKTVLCDRFTDASYAYQGGGRGMDLKHIAALETWVQADLRPDLVLLLDISAIMGLERIKHRSAQDRIEAETIEFFSRVRDVYLARAKANPQRYCIIDASQTLENVQAQIKAVLEQRIMLKTG